MIDTPRNAPLAAVGGMVYPDDRAYDSHTFAEACPHNAGPDSHRPGVSHSSPTHADSTQRHRPRQRQPWATSFVSSRATFHPRPGDAMWDTPEPATAAHLSHGLACPSCAHEIHTVIACGDTCDCPPCIIPGTV